MNRQKGLRFEARDEDFLMLGSESTNIRLTHHIAPQEFIKIYETISGTYDLEITQKFVKRFWETTTFLCVKRKAQPVPIAKFFIDFILDAHCLVGSGIEIKPMIQEFKGSGDMEALRHVCSLAFLSSIYARSGYDVEFPGRSRDSRNPDLCIDGTFADIKVRLQSDLEPIHREKGRVYQSTLSEDVWRDIGAAFLNRVYDGIKQAELVFIDMSLRSLPSIWLSDEFDTTGNMVPEPRPFRVVYFCKIGPNVFLGRDQTYSCFATYIDIDQHLWDFIKRSDRKIEHGLVGGPADIL